jgi:serine/tyrosine/threonine adenylyltransferase
MASEPGTTQTMNSGGWRFDNTYARLPEAFRESIVPTPVSGPRMVVFNHALAGELGLDAAVLDTPEGAAIFAGSALPQGAEPVAQAYAGHQYAHFTMLGDGRAILLGEHTAPGGRRLDIQLKGSGRTRYSRGGDGRAALGPMLREYVISEFMHAMGIPTTRSLAVAATGELVQRETALPGAVLTRVAASHLRVGTFEWAAATRDPAILRSLADYTRQRHFPQCGGDRAMFREIMQRQARLLALWMGCGFVHGVMNSDNMALSGETIDYGPCAFMDQCDPATVFSSIDRHGRYAYGRQPGIAHWNLARLAEAMLPLFDADESAALEWANAVIPEFSEMYEQEWLAVMCGKLGLAAPQADDRALAESLLEHMHRCGADYTNTFRALTLGRAAGPELDEDVDFLKWRARWQERQTGESRALMLRSNPAVIPRNHKVEEALTAATAGDLQPLHALLAVLVRPFDHAVEAAEYLSPALRGACYRTFCGT